MTIAIVGTNGFLGSAFLEIFKDPKFNTQDLIIVSRDVSKNVDTDKIKYYAYSDLDKVVQIAETLIVLTTANPDLYKHFYEVLSVPNKVKLYFPSTWGFEDKPVLEYLPGIIDFRNDHVTAVRKLGIKTVAVANGLFAIPNKFLYEFATEFVGLSSSTGELQYIGNGEGPLAVSNPHDIAKTVSSAIQLKDIPDNLNFYSDEITPKQLVAKYLKKHPNFKITKESSITLDEALEKSRQLIKSGYDFTTDFPFLLYTISASGKGKGLSYSDADRELVNPGESKWKWFNFENEA